jgi:hypothetical protein
MVLMSLSPVEQLLYFIVMLKVLLLERKELLGRRGFDQRFFARSDNPLEPVCFEVVRMMIKSVQLVHFTPLPVFRPL